MNHLLFFYLSRIDGSPLFRVFTKLYPSTINFSRENIKNVTSESRKAIAIYVTNRTGLHFHNPDLSAGVHRDYPPRLPSLSESFSWPGRGIPEE
jgi:hypothetical protein